MEVRLPNFHWIIEGFLAGMAQPGSSIQEPQQDLEQLKNLGFSVIISLTEKPLPLNLVMKYGMTPVHFPIEDFGAPAIKQAEEFCALLQKMEEEHRKVVVHCYAGLGRTGTMMGVYIIYKFNLTAREALSFLHQIEPGYVQSKEQEEFLYDWYNYLKTSRDGNS